MSHSDATIKVKLTQQQIELLDRLRAEGGHGDDYSSVLLNLFRKRAHEMYGEGRFAPATRSER